MNNEKNIFSDTYEIIGYLQSGSGGAVYKAYHKRLKKEVVLKRIKQKNVNMRINRQEVDILKNLNHSYLPQVLDFLNVDGEIYTVMSFIPGHSFKELLEEGVHFTQNQLIRWGMQLCSALYYLHSQNPPIVHGDIKPANIMLTPQGNICLIDFNISFFMDENTVLGYTEGYTSPEQYIIALDKKSIHAIPNHTVVDEKSDIYSVGATFYKEERAILLEARNNLPMENQMQILEKLIQVDINLDDDGDTQLRNEAINLSKEVIKQGWETYTTYNNLAILYQKQKNLAETADILTQMIELYGDDYNIEKRLAFLEIDKQEQKGNDFRDYSAFEKYYERAEKLYYAQLKSNDTDSEMQLLENVYQQVRSGGWL